ncbi:DNA/RNA non-specific endonuclease [Polyangium sp. 6x1]|uniref:DNA/RNA non-specific endonuclease n=1 Tax=Polyangium sp. 6x1 TaxID=3042689 RepID=UPI0024821E3A|nr:DNA/RNA non-specific endonuclease [Polyangium sp. 6x1]MDI1450236.1 DNA/RNA non-specific endonuclease [Polyangium sp. 6x1]
MRFTGDQMAQWQVQEPSVQRCVRGATRLRGAPAYQRESFAYQGQARERPSGVTFELAAGGARGRKRPREELETPLALVAPGGAVDPMVFHMDRFHLVAHRWGGSKESENLVPAYAGFNRTEWSNFEGEIDKVVQARGGPVRVTITPGYDDTQDPRVPVRLHVKVEEELLDGIFVQRHNGWFVPTPPTAQRAEDRWLEALIAQHHDNFVASGFSAHMLHDPSGMPLNLPNEPGPHAILDYLHINGHLAGTAAQNVTLKNGQEFTAAQRDLILMHNRIRNQSGFVISESPTDPARSWPAPPGRPPGTLLDGSTHAAPQVDHMYPQAHNGSNAYSNAMVMSAQHNNEKRSSVTPDVQAESALNRRRSPRG